MSEPLRHDTPVKCAWFDSGNRRVIVELADGTKRAWDLTECSVPVPDWLLELAEAAAGMRLDQKMRPVNVPWADRLNVQQRLAETVLVVDPQLGPDACRVVTASSNETARVWDLATGQPLIVLHGQESGVELLLRLLADG